MKTITYLVVGSVLLTQHLYAQKNGVELKKAEAEILATNKQFASDFHHADSVALGKHYASNAIFGSLKTNEDIVNFWGGYIRRNHAKGFNTVVYHTNVMATDGEFVTELGDFQLFDNNNNSGSKGKYCVIWKQENGEWKIYRDIGL